LTSKCPTSIDRRDSILAAAKHNRHREEAHRIDQIIGERRVDEFDGNLGADDDLPHGSPPVVTPSRRMSMATSEMCNGDTIAPSTGMCERRSALESVCRQLVVACPLFASV
jgi:hypothetical protein